MRVEVNMRVEYGKLWEKCFEQGISKSALFKQIGLSTQTLFEMCNNRGVSLKTIDKLCTHFKCQPSEIMEFIPDNQSASQTFADAQGGVS